MSWVEDLLPAIVTATMTGNLRGAIQQAHDLADRLIENLPHGHDLRRDLFQITAALEALSASIGISVDRMVPRIEANHDIAGLKFLLGALKRESRSTVSKRALAKQARQSAGKRRR